MKKIITLFFCALAAFTAKAQVEFIHNGEVVEDGATIEFHAEIQDFGGGLMFVECAPDEPFVKNVGASDTKIIVTVEKLQPETDKFTWCGITSSCSPMKDSKEVREGTLAAGAQSALALHADFEEGTYTTYTAKVTVKAGLTSSRTIYIKFIYGETDGIDATTMTDKVNVSGKTLSFDFANDAQRTLNIYGVSGRLVKSVKVGQNGNIALHSLPRGIYIYEVKVNGKRSQTHKFVIR